MRECRRLCIFWWQWNDRCHIGSVFAETNLMTSDWASVCNILCGRCLECFSGWQTAGTTRSRASWPVSRQPVCESRERSSFWDSCCQCEFTEHWCSSFSNWRDRHKRTAAAAAAVSEEHPRRLQCLLTRRKKIVTFNRSCCIIMHRSFTIFPWHNRWLKLYENTSPSPERGWSVDASGVQFTMANVKTLHC